jgi:hypothetical protein
MLIAHNANGLTINRSAAERSRLDLGCRQIDHATITPTGLAVNKNMGSMDPGGAIFLLKTISRMPRPTSCNNESPPTTPTPKSIASRYRLGGFEVGFSIWD